MVSGGVVGGLQVSARRDQYEQLLDTLRWIGGGARDDAQPAPAAAAQVPTYLRGIPFTRHRTD